MEKGLKKGKNIKDDGSLLWTAKRTDIQNSIRIPDRVVPKGITIEQNGNEIEYEMMPYSFVVMRLKEEKK